MRFQKPQAFQKFNLSVQRLRCIPKRKILGAALFPAGVALGQLAFREASAPSASARIDAEGWHNPALQPMREGLVFASLCASYIQFRKNKQGAGAKNLSMGSRVLYLSINACYMLWGISAGLLDASAVNVVRMVMNTAIARQIASSQPAKACRGAQRQPSSGKFFLPLPVAAVWAAALPLAVVSAFSCAIPKEVFSGVGGGIYIISSIPQALKTIRQKCAQGFSGISLSLGAAASIAWLACCIVAGDSFQFYLSLAATVLEAPVYYFKIKETMQKIVGRL